MNAALIDSKDNVAVVLEPISTGQLVSGRKDTRSFSVTARGPIPQYHKIAIEEIGAGSPIVKYGEHIGVAAEAIQAGTHVHIHNVHSHREVL